MVPPLGVSDLDTYVFGLSCLTGYAMTLAPSKSSAWINVGAVHLRIRRSGVSRSRMVHLCYRRSRGSMLRASASLMALLRVMFDTSPSPLSIRWIWRT